MNNTLLWITVGAVGIAVAAQPETRRVARDAGTQFKRTIKPDPPFPLPRTLEPYRAHIDRAARRNAVRPTLLAALVMVESSGNPHAVSPVNTELFGQPWFERTKKLVPTWSNQQLAVAWGLTQMLGATVVGEHGYRKLPTNLFDPGLNLDYGARHLAKQLARYRTQDKTAYTALIAYNGGHGAVINVINGVPVPESTRYARDVLTREQQILKGDA